VFQLRFTHGAASDAGQRRMADEALQMTIGAKSQPAYGLAAIDEIAPLSS
jgi:hypothetical protein